MLLSFFLVELGTCLELVFVCPVPPSFRHWDCQSRFSTFMTCRELDLTNPNIPPPWGPDSSCLISHPRILYVLEFTGVPTWGFKNEELPMLVPPAS